MFYLFCSISLKLGFFVALCNPSTALCHLIETNNRMAHGKHDDFDIEPRISRDQLAYRPEVVRHLLTIDEDPTKALMSITDINRRVTMNVCSVGRVGMSQQSVKKKQ